MDVCVCLYTGTHTSLSMYTADRGKNCNTVCYKVLALFAIRNHFGVPENLLCGRIIWRYLETFYFYLIVDGF